MNDEIPGFVAQIEDNPVKPYKAYTAAALSALATFVTFWLADSDPFTSKEIGAAALAALASAGVIGGGTFSARNPKVARNRDVMD